MIETMERMLGEIRQGLEAGLLQEVEFGSMAEGATHIRGRLPSGWQLLVVEFDIGVLGQHRSEFSGLLRCYEGTATRDGTVLRLTQELAQLAFEKARAS